MCSISAYNRLYGLFRYKVYVEMLLMEGKRSFIFHNNVIKIKILSSVVILFIFYITTCIYLFKVKLKNKESDRVRRTKLSYYGHEQNPLEGPD